jgi:peptide/bleomycin uptake transporter
MIEAFFRKKEWALWSYGGAFLILILLYSQVQIAVLVNSWYKGFYDLLQNSKDYHNNPQEGIMKLYDYLISIKYITSGFQGEASFAVIVIPYIPIIAFTNWFTKIYALKWREAMTFHYLPKWKNVENDIEGSSQRIQEDCFLWAKLLESLGLQFMRAIMMLIGFLPVLWSLSESVSIPFVGQQAGSLVWSSLLISLGGIFISFFVGWKLPGLHYNNQKVEAAFRKELVLAEDNKKNYAAQETIFSLFTGIRFNYKRLYLHYTYFDLWSSLYGQIMIIFPYVIVAPNLFTGLIQMGILIQISNAFGRVHDSFSVILDNWTSITELKSIWKRLNEFEMVIKKS